MVDMVVVNGVVGVVQAVHGARVVVLALGTMVGSSLLVLTTASIGALRSTGLAQQHIVTQDRLVEVAALQSSSHGHIPVEGQVNWLREKVSQFVPEAGVSPLHNWTVLQQVFEVLVDGYLVLADVLQLDKDHLGVVAHDAGHEGLPDLSPL